MTRMKATAAAIAIVCVLTGAIAAKAQDRPAALVIDLPAVTAPKLPANVYHDCMADCDARKAAANAAILRAEQAQAATGDVKAALVLGEDYLDATHTPHDRRRGIHWLTRAATAGSTDAMLDLGRLYAGTIVYSGDTGVIDGRKAVVWLDRASHAGSAAADTLLGELYLAGAVVPRDAVRAEAWYRRGAMTGDVFAGRSLADFYLAHGRPADAFAWYRRLAEGGDPTAMALLCQTPDALTPDLQAQARDLCAAHLKAIGALKAEPQAYPPQAFFDLTAVPAADQAALGQAVRAAVAAHVAATYPARAQDNGVEGWGEVDCRWTAAGGLGDCAWADEAPQGYGFGAASGRLLNGMSSAVLPGGQAGSQAGRQTGTWSRLRLVWHLK